MIAYSGGDAMKCLGDGAGDADERVGVSTQADDSPNGLCPTCRLECGGQGWGASGGVSAEEGDHILDSLRAEYAEPDVLKVAMRPGKPLSVCRFDESLYFGLLGNPYAAAMTVSQIAHPAMRRVACPTKQPISSGPGLLQPCRPAQPLRRCGPVPCATSSRRTQAPRTA